MKTLDKSPIGQASPSAKWLIILFCTLISEWQYLTTALMGCTTCYDRMQRIVDGIATPPFAYRLLTPHILVAMGNTPEAWALFHLIMLFLFFALLWSWVEQWNRSGIAAVALTTLALSVMYQTWYYSEYSITEWVLLLAALLLLSSWRRSTER